MQSGIFPENLASLAIHKACGFRELGFRERVAQLEGVWRNTLLLERRSRSVGV
ncbi:MAG: N-acetyltransferase family protein [Stenotrophomonas maltophilia]